MKVEIARSAELYAMRSEWTPVFALLPLFKWLLGSHQGINWTSLIDSPFRHSSDLMSPISSRGSDPAEGFMEVPPASRRSGQAYWRKEMARGLG